MSGGDLQQIVRSYSSLLDGTIFSDDQACQNAIQIVDQFFTTAGTYIKMIMAELHFKNREKMIKPEISEGESYSVHGLIFKIPTDTKISDETWMFGGNTANNTCAAKASNHYFNGVSYCQAVDADHFFLFPFLALIDYQGFRMLVSTTLPTNRSETLVYGSCDGGDTVKTDTIIHEKLKKIANRLNLRPHLITSEEPVEIALCGDLEIHKLRDEGKDRFFVLDLERVFPPVFPPKNSPFGSIFFRMFRPELLKKLRENIPQGFSSDALSAWQSADPNANQMNQDIVSATKFLEKEISEFSLLISKPISNFVLIDFEYYRIKFALSTHYHENLLGELHHRGINFRYLGMIVNNIGEQNVPIKNFLLGIMTARALKNIWRSKMHHAREKGISIVEASLPTLEETVNLATKNFSGIIPTMISMFGKGILPEVAIEELKKNLNVENIPITYSILRFFQMCGIVPNPTSALFTGGDYHFTRTDVVDFIVKLKYPPILEYYVGLHSLKQAVKEENSQAKWMHLQNALARLHNAMDYDIVNSRQLYYSTLEEIVKIDTTIGDAQFVKYAKDILENSVKPSNK